MKYQTLWGGIAFMALAVIPAFSATQIINAGGTLTLSADFTLAGNDTLQVNGTAQSPCTITGNSHQIKANTGTWVGQLKLTYCTANQLGTSALNGISLVPVGPASVIIEHCTFSLCGGTDLNSGGNSTVSYKNNTILANSVVPVDKAVEQTQDQFYARGSSPAVKYFQGNRIYRAHVSITGPNWMVGGSLAPEGNVLVGLRVRLDVSGAGSIVRNNYLHVQMPRTSQYPYWSQVHTFSTSGGALAEYNVIRDGEWVVQFIDGEFRYNLLCDINDHDLYRGGSRGRIHHNIFLNSDPQDHPGGSISSNLMIMGGSYAGPGVEVFNNVFDGCNWFPSPVLEADTGATVKSLRNNVFFRFKQGPMYIWDSSAVISTFWDEPINPAYDRLLYSDYNCFYNPLNTRIDNYILQVNGKTERRSDGFGAHDLPPGGTVNQQLDPQFKGPLVTAFPFTDADVESGKTTVPQILDYFWNIYTPATGSPLLGAGDPADGMGTDIGVVQVSPVGIEGKVKAEGMQLEAWPNPFKSAVSFELFAVSKGKIPDLSIYSASGRCVIRLTARRSPLAAVYTWNASNMPTGVYVARLQTGERVISKRLFLIK